ncbi:hypothetical protein EVAR_87244_1 [Eumeta japonica]|uniref:Uncharacterized protein n=1 Tax=Eumeta variegata TaxID=151549 RepID=A0A4C1YR12_EUMVA|nr:hypothetical protein EVAR_87244_1 [Eumeta japonica]
MKSDTAKELSVRQTGIKNDRNYNRKVLRELPPPFRTPYRDYACSEVDSIIGSSRVRRSWRVSCRVPLKSALWLKYTYLRVSYRLLSIVLWRVAPSITGSRRGRPRPPRAGPMSLGVAGGLEPAAGGGAAPRDDKCLFEIMRSGPESRPLI